MLQHIFLFDLLIILLIIARTSSRSADYWSEEFDSNKNCLQEKKIIKLRDQVLKEATLVPYQPLLLFQDV